LKKESHFKIKTLFGTSALKFKIQEREKKRELTFLTKIKIIFQFKNKNFCANMFQRKTTFEISVKYLFDINDFNWGTIDYDLILYDEYEIEKIANYFMYDFIDV
jgi:hypothetical protein